jgi:hypothetical protein
MLSFYVHIAKCLTVCVADSGAGVDSAWKQYKHEATLREMLAVGGADSRQSGAP